MSKDGSRALSKAQNTKPFRVAGVEVNIATADQLLERISDAMRAESGFSVATLNLDHYSRLRRDAAFAHAYSQFDFVTADGFPIVWAGRIAGRTLWRTTGADLVTPLLSLAARGGHGVALIGAAQTALDRAAQAARALAPELNILLTLAPSERFDPNSPEADAIIEKLRASGAKLCFLALSAPKQEIFAIRARDQCPSIGIVGVGAGVDFLAGSKRRAPALAQRLNLEWLWRLMREPTRLGARYARAAAALPPLFVTAIRARA